MNYVAPSGFAAAGEYGNVGGHHVHAKAAFKGDANPDNSEDFMKQNGWNHSDMTKKQRVIKPTRIP